MLAIVSLCFRSDQTNGRTMHSLRLYNLTLSNTTRRDVQAFVGRINPVLWAVDDTEQSDHGTRMYSWPWTPFTNEKNTRASGSSRRMWGSLCKAIHDKIIHFHASDKIAKAIASCPTNKGKIHSNISSQGTSKPKPPPKTQSCNNSRKKKSGTRCVSGPVSIPSPYEKKTIACKFHVLGTCSRRDCPWSHNPRICADAKRHLGLPFTDSELKAAGTRRQSKDHSPALLGDSSSSDGTVSKCKSCNSA